MVVNASILFGFGCFGLTQPDGPAAGVASIDLVELPDWYPRPSQSLTSRIVNDLSSMHMSCEPVQAPPSLIVNGVNVI